MRSFEDHREIDQKGIPNQVADGAAADLSLPEIGVSVAVRETRGRDIDAACGQLRGHTLVQIDKKRARATT